jgi:hypothetical protein
MATVTPVPFAIGLLGSLAIFGAWVHYLLQESERPPRSSKPVLVEIPHVSHVPHVSHTRIALIGMFFVVWSIWSTARPVSGWR